MQSGLHNRNKSLNDDDLINLYRSPRVTSSKDKSWSSANNLSSLENSLKYGCDSPRKSIIKRRSNHSPDFLSINIESIDNYSNDMQEEDEMDTDHEDNTISYGRFMKIFKEANLYIKNLMGYFYYLIISVLSTIIFNGATRERFIFPIDSLLFVYLSPVFYKLCFRQIFFHSLKNNINMIKYFYPLSVIIGFCIRFLDYIPFFTKFVLNTESFINSPEYVALFCVLICYMFAIFFNELYKSEYRKLNFCFLIAGGLFIFFTITYNVNNNYIIHVHHYFIGLVFHTVCQTKKSKISVINNGLGLGVFLEGISRWGFATIYYRIWY